MLVPSSEWVCFGSSVAGHQVSGTRQQDVTFMPECPHFIDVRPKAPSTHGSCVESNDGVRDREAGRCPDLKEFERARISPRMYRGTQDQPKDASRDPFDPLNL